jgi:Na+/proline symporter
VRPAPAITLDAALVVGFAALGRRSHEEGVTLVGVLEVAAPFLIALAAGWLVARAWRAPAALRTGAVVWAVTVAGGLLLRSAVFDRGVAPSFVVVTAITLGVMLVGWRAVSRIGPLRRALHGA